MRKTYLDNVRWITIVLVVFYHVIFMYNAVQTSLTIGPFAEKQYQDSFLYLVYPWFMLLLFTVAGMTSRFYLEHHTNKEFIKARTLKLLVPSTIGLFVFQWIQGYYSMAINGALGSMVGVPKAVNYIVMALSGQGVLWFAELLWIFSLLLVLIRKIEKDKFYNICGKANIIVLLLLTVVVYLFAQILNFPLITVFRMGFYGSGYLIGYFVLSYDEVIERLTKYWLYLTIAAVIIGITFTAVYFGEDYTDHAVLDTVLCNVYAWIAVLAVLAFMNKWGNKENSFSRWMNRESWGLYVFHYTVLSAVAYYLHIYAPNLPALLTYIITAVTSFVGAFALYEIISRIPVIRWCVLGIKGDKKNVQR